VGAEHDVRTAQFDVHRSSFPRELPRQAAVAAQKHRQLLPEEYSVGTSSVPFTTR
jgi:hypothetical protein